ncbi:MAG TPA: lytic polysaccharide monooxygenase [Vicinamibacteria bacterium]
MKRTSLSSLSRRTLFGLVAVVAPVLASPHGTMETPPSRQYICFKEGPESPGTPACAAGKAISGTQWLYDWNGYNSNPSGLHQQFIPDGQLCGAAHPNYDAANLPRTDWQMTSVARGANLQFTYLATAPHATQYHRIYVTRQGYNPTQRLRWADLEQICETGDVPLVDQRYRFTCRMPSDRTGRHVIYHVWQRPPSQSPEAFYACIDVNFGGPAPSPTPTPTPSPTPPPTTTTTTMPPPTTTTTLPPGGTTWQVGATYAVGQIVTYQGVRYRCIQAHTVHSSTWTPPASPSLWTRA